MYLSNREKKLVNIFLEQPNGVTIDYLSEQLSVSNRTTYRVISSMESALAQFQIKLTMILSFYISTATIAVWA